MVKDTISQEYQRLLYGLFREKLFNMEGQTLENEQGLLEEYIPKSEFIDNAVEILNEFGKLMSEDRRFQNETDAGTD